MVLQLLRRCLTYDGSPVMGPSIYDRILRRELGESSRYSSVRGLYGDRAWIGELDIVSELGGHSGCVNALR